MYIREIILELCKAFEPMANASPHTDTLSDFHGRMQQIYVRLSEVARKMQDDRELD